jgi:hypothetical protein
VDWVELAEKIIQFREFSNTVMNLRVVYKGTDLLGQLNNYQLLKESLCLTVSSQNAINFPAFSSIS